MVHPRSLTQLFQLFIGFSRGCLVCVVFPCLSQGTGAVLEALQALPRADEELLGVQSLLCKWQKLPFPRGQQGQEGLL